jgi:hypothetical protein
VLERRGFLAMIPLSLALYITEKAGRVSQMPLSLKKKRERFSMIWKME